MTTDIYTFVRHDAQRSAFERMSDALGADDVDGNGHDDDAGTAGRLVAV
ncbi:hypothetical protein [Streptomyces sp. B8F3]